MDISLKGHTDGIEAAAAIKKMFRIPVVFLTASSNDEDLERAKMIRLDGFIVKPFNDTDIRVALKLALPYSGQEPLINPEAFYLSARDLKNPDHAGVTAASPACREEFLSFTNLRWKISQNNSSESQERHISPKPG